jgi:hypothetical protein
VRRTKLVKRPTPEEIRQVRQKAEEITTRLSSDPSFAQRTQDNPKDILESKGALSEAVNEIILDEVPPEN